MTKFHRLIFSIAFSLVIVVCSCDSGDDDDDHATPPTDEAALLECVAESIDLCELDDDRKFVALADCENRNVVGVLTCDRLIVSSCIAEAFGCSFFWF